MSELKGQGAQPDPSPPVIIPEFKGEYFYLSNFYRSPLTYLGYRCSTAEHAFQLAKATTWAEQNRVVQAVTARDAKSVGRRILLRPDWEEVKLRVMREVVTLKFATDPIARVYLVGTGDAKLIEGNRWGDTFWGKDIKTGVGENYLGRILMQVRQVLRSR